MTTMGPAYYHERKRQILSGEIPTPEYVHGTTNGYGNWFCRCEGCCRAWSLRQKEYLARHPEQVARKQARKTEKRRQDRQLALEASA